VCLAWRVKLPYTRTEGNLDQTMRLRGQNDDQLDIRMSIDEFMLLKNMLHEVCTGMHFSDNDFQAIFGTNRAEAEALLRRTENVLERLRLIAE
jgi:hypothetical protein